MCIKSPYYVQVQQGGCGSHVVKHNYGKCSPPVDAEVHQDILNMINTVVNDPEISDLWSSYRSMLCVAWLCIFFFFIPFLFIALIADCKYKNIIKRMKDKLNPLMVQYNNNGSKRFSIRLDNNGCNTTGLIIIRAEKKVNWTKSVPLTTQPVQVVMQQPMVYQQQPIVSQPIVYQQPQQQLIYQQQLNYQQPMQPMQPIQQQQQTFVTKPQNNYQQPLKQERKEDLISVYSEDNSDSGYKIMYNPYVLLMGVSMYGGNDNLPGTKNDVQNMYSLFKYSFKYKHIKMIIDNLTIQNICTILQEEVRKIRLLLDKNERIDGCIVYFSGHGSETGIVLPSNKSNKCSPFSFITLQEQFSIMYLPQLSNKPKLFYYDCCKGSHSIGDGIEVSNKGGYQQKNSREDVYVTNAAADGTTAKEYTFPTGRAGCLTKAICNIYKKIEYNKSLDLIDSELEIKKEVGKISDKTQTAQTNSTLTYKVLLYKGNYF